MLVDQDDPEQRIADLERQLAELRAARDPVSRTGGRLTVEQVRSVAFSKPPIGRRGYNEAEVDAFLDLVEAALRDPPRRALTAEQVRSVAFSKPPIGKRGYNEAEVDSFLDLVEAALVDPRESDTFRMRVNEGSAASGEPVRCLLRPFPSVWKRQPPLLIDVGKDAIWVRDPNTNALIASDPLAQVTATPAEETTYSGEWPGTRTYTQPFLVLHVPGLKPLTIATTAMSGYPIQYRFSWRGTVGRAKKPDHFATEAEFLKLVGKFGLAPNLEDKARR